MTSEEWAQLERLFDEACQQPTASRAGWLLTHCPDPAMRALVAEMLATFDADPGFLETSPDVAGSVAAAIADSLVGARLGPYRLTGQIGRGGMGVVYDAVRDDGEFERRVAIKVLPSWSGAALAERFRLERRVLAALDHPGIARLVDSGTTPDGAPYFVMEFVDGLPIDVWARERRLDVPARIALVARVCNAVAYAHQHLVVHRDIKPANILVPADGHPRLLDFGIATLLSDPDGADTGATLTNHQRFTIDFASPEQIRGEAVTTASDVYSLGVLLYLLVTGQRPLDLKGLSPLEAMRRVCEVDPPPASTVAAVSDASSIRGDLDAVIGKALSKAPRDRYPTVAALASDLEAIRAGLPVSAAPESWGRRARRFVRRNKAAAAVMAAIVAGGGAATWQARVAAIERDRAERRFDQVRQFSRSLIFDVNEALSQVPGNVEPRRLVLERAVEFLDGLTADVGNDRALRLELVEGYRQLGTVQGGPTTENGGDRAAARRSLEKAARLVDVTLAEDPSGLEPLMAGLDVMADLHGVIARLGGDAKAAEDRHRALLTELESLKSPDPPVVEAIARGYATIGGVLESRSDYVGAERSLSTALTLLEGLSAAGAKRQTRTQRAAVLKRLGAVLQWQTRFDAAERRYREALALDEETLAEYPGNPAAQFEVTITLSNLYAALSKLGRREEGMPHLSRALVIRRSLVAADPKDVRATEGLALLLGRLSTNAYEARRFADSVSYNREKVQLREAIVRREGSTPRTRTDRALARLELAMALVAQADAGAPETRPALLEEAGALLRETPVSDFTQPTATAGVSVEVFRAQHALLLARVRPVAVRRR